VLDVRETHARAGETGREKSAPHGFSVGLSVKVGQHRSEAGALGVFVSFPNTMWLLLLAQLAQPAKPAPVPPTPPARTAPKPAEPAPAAASSSSGSSSPSSAPSGSSAAGGSGSASAAGGVPVEVRDPRTTGAEGRDVIPLDPRTTRDEQFDPRAAAQAEEERRESAARVLRAQQQAGAGSRVRLIDPEGRLVQHRPLEITTTASLVAGYNSNVIQTTPVINGPVERHPALYNAVEGRVELEFWGKGEEPQQLSLQVLGQQYYKLDDVSLPQDGSVLGLYGGTFAIGRQTRLGVRAFSSVQTLNSSRQQDGVLFQVDPANLQRTFTLSNLTLQLSQEITPTTRYVHVAGVTASTTLRDEPTLLNDGSRLFHRGLDYLQFNTSGTVLHDFGQKVRGFADVEYEGLYNNFFLDFTRVVPVRRGDFSVHVGRANTGATYFASDALSLTGRVGVSLATPPPISVPAVPDPNAPAGLDADDRSAIFSPQGGAELLYQKPTFDAQLSTSYTFGSANPRIGYGRTFAVDGHIGGVPFPSDRTFRNFAVLFTASVNRAILRPNNDGDGKLTFVGMTALVRYKVTNWLGLLGGYSNRYVNFSGTLAAPDLMRHQVFFGVSGYFTTDTTEPPPLSVFAPPRPTG
jgi:hypothetical protein